MLNKLPEIRLGGSYHNIKKHKWFAGFNWVNAHKYILKYIYKYIIIY